MSTLIVASRPAHADARADPDLAQEFEFVVASGDGTVLNQGQAVAALLPKANQTWLLARRSLLSFHAVTVPKIAPPRMKAALAGLLEERLLDDPEALVMALSPGAAAGEAAWVAVAARAPLDADLSALAANGHHVDRVVPEFAPLSGGERDALWAMGEEVERGVVTHVSSSGVVAYALGPWRAADWWARQSPSTQGVAELAAAYAEPALVAALEAQLATVPSLAGIKARVLTPPQRWAALAAQTPADIAADLGAASGWNLRQMDWAAPGRSGAWLRRTWQSALHPRWRWARRGLVAAVALQVLGLNAWAWQQSKELQQLQQARSTLLTQSFPQIKLVVDAPLQMSRALSELRSQAGAPDPSDAQSLLGVLARASHDITATPQRLSYEGAKLTAVFRSDDVPQLSALTQTLRALGAEVTAEESAGMINLTLGVSNARLAPATQP